MKRDLEIKPLIAKEENTKSPACSVLAIFEVLVVCSSVSYLPFIDDECPDSPLRKWAVLLIGICGAHLGVFTLERLTSNSAIASVHLVIISALVAWLGLGHYWVAVRGIDCNGSNEFLACSLLLVCFDILLTGMGSSLLVNYCRPKNLS